MRTSNDSQTEAGGPMDGRCRRSTEALFSLIQAAGWPIWLLVVTSVVALALIVERGLTLQRSRTVPEQLLDEVLSLYRSRQLTVDVLHRLERSSALGRVLASGLRRAGAPRELIKEAMEDAGRAAAHDLQRYLGALATIATVAPLLGLFGTVVGMIELFGAQTPAGSNPQQLAHGISVALYNTAFGLLVAIPAMIAYRWYRGRVDDLLAVMEQQALRLLEALRSDAPRASR